MAMSIILSLLPIQLDHGVYPHDSNTCLHSRFLHSISNYIVIHMRSVGLPEIEFSTLKAPKHRPSPHREPCPVLDPNRSSCSSSSLGPAQLHSDLRFDWLRGKSGVLQQGRMSLLRH